MKKPILYLISLIIVVGLLQGLTGCDRGNGGRRQQVAQKPALGGNVTFQMHGSTDDGDDGNGAAQRYQSPRNNSADNRTTATSTPTTYRDISAMVNAKPGNNATRLAVALANSKATSTFTVVNQVTCRLFINSAGSVSLTSGIGDYHVVARIRDAAGLLVQGSDIQGKYDFKENNANPRKLDIKRWGQANGTMPNGGVVLRPDRSGPFTLTPGNYELEFELIVNGKADTDAKLNITAQVDLL